MIPPETVAQIRHLFHAEHWKVGTIAAQLGVHHDTVRRALQTDRFNRDRIVRPTLVDPYTDFIRENLSRYPRLRATRIYQMIVARGYRGSECTVRRAVAGLRPTHREAFLRLRTFPGEQAQVDWASFGKVAIGRAERNLSCFVLTLSHSRALYLEFFFDQTLENFLRGHVHAFSDWGGAPRIILSDNLRSAVLERRGDAVQFHPRLLELCAHYHFTVRPCQVARGFMGIYPPWLRTFNSQFGESRASLGYAFIFQPPPYSSASVDLTRLSIQALVVLAVTIGLLLVLKEGPAGAHESKASESPS